jgi:geranylgeranyl pyrophosphate synthase
LHLGQGWDIQWHKRKGRVPSEAQYFHMVENKTSCLPRMCLRHIAHLTDTDEEMTQRLIKFTNSLGAAFQLQDDIIAVTSEQYRKERGVYCEDIQEGKRSLMVIYSYWYGWKGDNLVELLDQKSSDEEVHKAAIKILEHEGAIDYAKEKARLVMRRAWEDLEPTLKTGQAKDDIHDMSQFLMNRDL